MKEFPDNMRPTATERLAEVIDMREFIHHLGGAALARRSKEREERDYGILEYYQDEERRLKLEAAEALAEILPLESAGAAKQDFDIQETDQLTDLETDEF